MMEVLENIMVRLHIVEYVTVFLESQPISDWILNKKIYVIPIVR
jgi:hypothetical protein